MDQQGNVHQRDVFVGRYSFEPYQSNKNGDSSPPKSVVPIQSPQSLQSPQSTGLPITSEQIVNHQLPYQHIHQQQQMQQHEVHQHHHIHQQQQQMQQQVKRFWANQIEQVNDFKKHSLPWARIKRIMKEDENVTKISAETPVILVQACEMFIQELTLRAWNNTKENKRKIIQKYDIQTAISRDEMFDFLVDIVPREDLKDEWFASTIPIEGGVGPAVGSGGAVDAGSPVDQTGMSKSVDQTGMSGKNVDEARVGGPVEAGMSMGKSVDQAGRSVGKHVDEAL